MAALHQQHFGAAMDRLHLPGSWSSTGNAIEALAFHAKDVLLVVDDFAPQGNAGDVSRYHAAADRVFRAVGNHAGRTRLEPSARLRESKPPRALILSTGEDVPRGQSIRARLLVVELSKGEITSTALTQCQQDARSGLYAHSMGAFIQWIASRREELRTRFEQRVTENRELVDGSLAHARTPVILADLQASFELFLEFALEAVVIDRNEQDRLAQRCWAALGSAAAAQAKHQAAGEPAARFVCLLRSLLSSGRIHLEARNGGEPCSSPGSCGWRRDGAGNWNPLGECVGWVDENDLYLEPTAAFRAVQVAGRDIGEMLPISETTLKKRLKEKGYLATTDEARGTLTVRRIICGEKKCVLHLMRSTLLAEVSDGDEDAE